MIDSNLLKLYEYGGREEMNYFDKIAEKVSKSELEEFSYRLDGHKVKLNMKIINKRYHLLSPLMLNFLKSYENEMFIARRGIGIDRLGTYSLEPYSDLIKLNEQEKMLIFENQDLLDKGEI